MQARLRLAEKMTFVGTAESNHAVVMDTVEEAGGTRSAASPMEHMLMAIGACSAMDVVVILRKKRIKYDSFEIRLNAERRQEHPRIFTNIEVEYAFTGKGLEEQRDHFETAAQLSQEKYCSVAGMLSDEVKLTRKITLSASEE